MSDDYAIVGAKNEDEKGTHAGAVYIFQRDGDNWQQQAKLTGADREADDKFGFCVGISGDYTIVGAYLEDEKATQAGAAYIFQPPNLLERRI
ncbi:MAG: hypothetical protein F6K58_21585 [Symploca sp. SIO2E9]|nr:hypothetical protein [Symploca sp. SIO2E9]